MWHSQVVSRSIPSTQILPALVAALLWCVAAAGAVYWGLQFPQGAVSSVPEVVASAPMPVTDTAQMARALGQAQVSAAVAPESSRFQLLGVISFSSGHGSALLAVDGQPPKAWRIGQAVQDGVYLQKVGPRQAWLGTSLTGSAQWELHMAGPERP